ncbi:uncharacterized protein [Panulirus ornatus]|uniref:uncharacterized protein isoform X2 n=1 Tax=Panulirus ornatus TaxID=150431 RepID=UPI003A885586
MTQGMLSLSWNNHSATFTHTLSTLREKERYTDVTLACDGKFYPVHKLVLSTCSEYFMRMFDTTPCKHPIVVLKDVHCKEMESLLSYMYAGVVSVAQSDLPQLIKVAEALQIKGLAVPDESLCSNMNFGHTWSPTDDRSSPYPKRIRREENGTQTQRILEPRSSINSQSLTRIQTFSGITPSSQGGPQGFTTIGSSFSNVLAPHRFSPYHRDGDLQHLSPRQIHRLDQRKDQAVTPKMSQRIDNKSENRITQQSSLRTNQRVNTRTDQNSDSKIDKGLGQREDQILNKKADHLDDCRKRDTDNEDDTSSELQELLPVNLVKVEVKDVDDEHIEVDNNCTDCGHGPADPESHKVSPSLQPRSEANEFQVQICQEKVVKSPLIS